MKANTKAIARGLSALAKCAIVIAGVPVALVRLWFVSTLPRPLLSAHGLSSLSSWTHLVLLVVAAIWFWAAFALARELLEALRHPEQDPRSSWASRWAVAVVGLIVVLTGLLSTPQAPRGPSRAPSAITALAPSAAPVRRSAAGVQAGESLEHVAERAIGQRDAWRAIARANLNRLLPDGRRMVDGNLLRPGWELLVPAGSEQTSTVGAGARSTTKLEDLSILGIGILTIAGLARRSRLLRRVARARRDPFTRRAALDQQVGNLAAMLAAFEESSLIDWIDAANRLLWLALQSHPGEAPEIELVRAGPDGVEFLLKQATGSPPAPFRADQSGRWWRLEATIGPLEAARRSTGAGRYCPGLIPIGDDGLATYLLPLGAGRRLSLRGDGDAVERYLLAVVVALRVLPWTSELEVSLAGMPAPSAKEQSYHLEETSLPALREISRRPAPARATRLQRVWHQEPVIVVAPDFELDEGLLGELSARAGLVGIFSQASSYLDVHEDTVVLQPFGLELRPGAPGREQLAIIDALLIDAARYAGPFEAEKPLVAEPSEHVSGSSLRLCVLDHEVSLSGAQGEVAPHDERRATELVCYLALHGKSATRSVLQAALFGAWREPYHDAALERVLGAARLLLGRNESGHPYLRTEDDMVLLDASLSCDWTETALALERAGRLVPSSAIALLHAALANLKGRPFEDAVIGYRWILAEGIDDQVHDSLIDGAHHLAALASASGSQDLARWAIEKGRLIEPASEILIRDLMASYEATGEIDALRATFHELEAALSELEGNEPSPATRSYYERLIESHQGPAS